MLAATSEKLGMDHLLDFYAENQVAVPEHDFNCENNDIEVLDAFADPNTPAQCVVSRQTTQSLPNWMRPSNVSGRQSFFKIVLVPVFKTRDPYRFDIKEENFDFVMKGFGLERLRRFAHASDMNFDIIPKTDRDTVCGFLCSIFIVHFVGLYMMYDHRAGPMKCVCWATITQLSRLRTAFIRFKDMAQHPFYLLFCAAIAFNSYQDYRLSKVHNSVSSLERRTGYHAWTSIAFPTAQGSFSELSAGMSGSATSLATSERLVRMVEEILNALDDVSLLSGQIDSQSCRMIDTHVKVIRRRLKVQLVLIDLLASRVQNQLTAVSTSLYSRLLKSYP